MSKLDGTERWETKMLSDEERTIVRDLIFLPHIDTMVSRSLKEIEHSSNVLKRAYLMAGQAVQYEIKQDTYQLQQELKKRNVRFILDEQDEFISYYKIFCRGYQERFGMTRDVMRTEISLRLTKYSADFGAILKDQLK